MNSENKKFPFNPSGFNDAKEWAKSQIYDTVKNRTLWDFVDGAFNLTEEKLHFINKIYSKKK
jgi:hypothetical protein